MSLEPSGFPGLQSAQISWDNLDFAFFTNDLRNAIVRTQPWISYVSRRAVSVDRQPWRYQTSVAEGLAADFPFAVTEDSRLWFSATTLTAPDRFLILRSDSPDMSAAQEILEVTRTNGMNLIDATASVDGNTVAILGTGSSGTRDLCMIYVAERSRLAVPFILGIADTRIRHGSILASRRGQVSVMFETNQRFYWLTKLPGPVTPFVARVDALAVNARRRFQCFADETLYIATSSLVQCLLSDQMRFRFVMNAPPGWRILSLSAQRHFAQDVDLLCLGLQKLKPVGNGTDYTTLVFRQRFAYDFSQWLPVMEVGGMRMPVLTTDGRWLVGRFFGSVWRQAVPAWFSADPVGFPSPVPTPSKGHNLYRSSLVTNDLSSAFLYTDPNLYSYDGVGSKPPTKYPNRAFSGFHASWQVQQSYADSLSPWLPFAVSADAALWFGVFVASPLIQIFRTNNPDMLGRETVLTLDSSGTGSLKFFLVDASVSPLGTNPALLGSNNNNVVIQKTGAFPRLQFSPSGGYIRRGSLVSSVVFGQVSAVFETQSRFYWIASDEFLRLRTLNDEPIRADRVIRHQCYAGATCYVVRGESVVEFLSFESTESEVAFSLAPGRPVTTISGAVREDGRHVLSLTVTGPVLTIVFVQMYAGDSTHWTPQGVFTGLSAGSLTADGHFVFGLMGVEPFVGMV